MSSQCRCTNAVTLSALSAGLQEGQPCQRCCHHSAQRSAYSTCRSVYHVAACACPCLPLSSTQSLHWTERHGRRQSRRGASLERWHRRLCAWHGEIPPSPTHRRPQRHEHALLYREKSWCHHSRPAMRVVGLRACLQQWTVRDLQRIFDSLAMCRVWRHITCTAVCFQNAFSVACAVTAGSCTGLALCFVFRYTRVPWLAPLP